MKNLIKNILKEETEFESDKLNLSLIEKYINSPTYLNSKAQTGIDSVKLDLVRGRSWPFVDELKIDVYLKKDLYHCTTHSHNPQWFSAWNFFHKDLKDIFKLFSFEKHNKSVFTYKVHVWCDGKGLSKVYGSALSDVENNPGVWIPLEILL